VAVFYIEYSPLKKINWSVEGTVRREKNPPIQSYILSRNEKGNTQFFRRNI